MIDKVMRHLKWHISDPHIATQRPNQYNGKTAGIAFITLLCFFCSFAILVHWRIHISHLSRIKLITLCINKYSEKVWHSAHIIINSWGLFTHSSVWLKCRFLLPSLFVHVSLLFGNCLDIVPYLLNMIVFAQIDKRFSSMLSPLSEQLVFNLTIAWISINSMICHTILAALNTQFKWIMHKKQSIWFIYAWC